MLQTYLTKFQELQKNKKLAIASVGIAFLLGLTKLYFGGGVCRIKKSLQGKIAVVTGGNCGIGKSTVEQLLKRGCTVIIGSRDDHKSLQVVNHFKVKYPTSTIFTYHLDLGDRESIQQFAKNVTQNVTKIDILINNAGVMGFPNYQLTTDGYQMHMGVNHFGHFYLTFLLWAKLMQSEEPRIINVSAQLHRGFNFKYGNLQIDFNNINLKKGQGYNPIEAYGRSKAANILFTKELQRRMDAKNIPGIAVSLHPGVVRTELGRHATLGLKFVNYLFTPLRLIMMKNEWQGAQTTLYLALQQRNKLQGGGYYLDCKLRNTSPFTSDAQNIRKLWQVSERQTRITFDI